MSTKHHVVIPNFQTAGVNSYFNSIWALTRGVKSAGWKYLASGNGTSKDTSADPELDLWGSNTATANPGGSAASIAAPTRGRATITGLSGIVAADKGRFLRITGAATGANNHQHQIEEIISSTSVRIDARTFAVASDANNGSLSWTIRDAVLDTYPSALDSVVAWWCARGPSTMKIPITASPSPGPSGLTFVRGENVVQSTTGAEGEILGYVYEAGTGYLVVAPRLRGTGGDPYGWATGNLITGGTSGATVSQNGTVLEYRHEIVLWKAANTTAGLFFCQTYEPVSEGAANAFSALATASGCTATVGPGGGGTGNAFPTFAWVAAGSGTAIANAAAWHSTSSTTWGKAQIMCADAIEEQNYSADGSWTWALQSGVIDGGAFCGLSFMRCDDPEDGDLDPYVTMNAGFAATLYSNNRTTAGAVRGNNPFESFTTASPIINSTSFCGLKGWRRRGLSGDSGTNLQDFEFAFIRYHQTSTTPALATNTSDPERVATAIGPTQVKVREPLWVVSSQFGRKMRKGTMRWGYLTQGGGGGDLYDDKKLIQLSPTNAPFVWGPWDETTTPIA